MQTVRHRHDAILTGIGTVLEDDPLMTDRSGLPRRRPLLRIVVDSLCRLPLESKLVQSYANDLIVATTSAAPASRREALEQRGVSVWVCDSPKGRVDLKSVIEAVGKREMLSVMIEAGSKLNWAALDEGLVDKVLIYYAPKILGGMESLPVAGGVAGAAARARSSSTTSRSRWSAPTSSAWRLISRAPHHKECFFGAACVRVRVEAGRRGAPWRARAQHAVPLQWPRGAVERSQTYTHHVYGNC